MKKRNIGIVLTTGAVGLGVATVIMWLGLMLANAIIGNVGADTLNQYGVGVDPGQVAAAQQMLMRVSGYILAGCAVIGALGIWLIVSAGKAAATIATLAFIAKAWEFTKKNFWLMFKVVIFMVVVNILLSIPAFMYEDNVWVVQISDLFGTLASLYIEIGFVGIALLLVSGKKADFNALFVSLKPYVNFVIATFLYSIIVGLGFILLIIPGIYFSLKYQLFPFFIIDRKAGIFDSFRLSSMATQGVKLDMLLLGLVLQVLTVLALIPLGLGLFVMIPLSLLAWTLVYKKLESKAK